jgi:hypothetical protein
MLEAYLRQRMQKAVRYLSATADVLAEVLIDIVELQEIAYSPLVPPGCIIATVFVDPYGKSIQEKQDGGK